MAFFILPINLISFILNYNNMDKSKQKRCSHEKCNKKLKLIVFDCKCVNRAREVPVKNIDMRILL